MGAYENPITVVNTESAKAWANMLTSLGKSGSKILDDRKAVYKQNKAQNLKNANLRTKFNSEYTQQTNKILKDFSLHSKLGPILNEKITEAANVKTLLYNETDETKRTELQNELNRLERFFGVGLGSATTSFAGMRSDTSELQEFQGKEGGLSLSLTSPIMNQDINSTFDGLPDEEYDLGITLVDGEYNLGIMFGGERYYNMNKDFTPQSMVINPHIDKGMGENMDVLKITKNGVFDPKTQIGRDLIKKDKNGESVKIIKDGYYYETVDETLLYPMLRSNLEVQIGGILSSGRAEEGDSGYGYSQMESWLGDILPEKYSEGLELDLDVSKKSGLTNESFDKLSHAIVKWKKDRLDMQMMPRGEVESEEEEITTTIQNRIDLEKRDEKIRLAGFGKTSKKLIDLTIPKFTEVKTKEQRAFTDAIQSIPGISIDAKNSGFTDGDAIGYIIKGSGAPQGMKINNKMNSTELDKIILRVSGATSKEIEEFMKNKHVGYNTYVTTSSPTIFDGTN